MRSCHRYVVAWLRVLTLHNVYAVHCWVRNTIGVSLYCHDYSEGYREYTGECSVHLGEIMNTSDVYHDKCGGRSSGKQLNLYRNPSVLNTSPSVVVISPTLITVSLSVLMVFPSVYWTPPPAVLMISPSVLKSTSVLHGPWCTAPTSCRVFLLLLRHFCYVCTRPDPYGTGTKLVWSSLAFIRDLADLL